MTDLQCPATVVLVPDAAAVASVPSSRFRVADVRHFSSPAGSAGSAAELDAYVSDVADEFRGECVAVVAPAGVIGAVLRRRGLPVPASASEPGSAAPEHPGIYGEHEGSGTAASGPDAGGGRAASAAQDGHPAEAAGQETGYVAVSVDSGGWALLP